MDRWKQKIAVVTGASSGVGAATARALVSAGMIVVGLARRENRILALTNDLPECSREYLHAVKCDLTKEEDIICAFQWVVKTFGGVDVLINNAGISKKTPLLSDKNTEDLQAVMNTNCWAPIFCTREAYRSMKCRNVDGHIVCVNAIAGHTVPYFAAEALYNIYPATKFSITALVESYRQEFLQNKSKVKITSISPGAVDTDFLTDDVREGPIKGQQFLRPEDVANAIMYTLQTPPHVQVQEITVKSIGEKL